MVAKDVNLQKPICREYESWAKVTHNYFTVTKTKAGFQKRSSFAARIFGSHFHLVFKIPLIESPTAVTEVYEVIFRVIVHL